ncbi:Protein LIN37 [Trinorchestia longiramus]|nr:Protein LIN37 [Trinorchestia longiramus]
MSGDSESDIMRVKLEIDESAGDLDVAREKFESALQDLLFKEEVSDSEADEQQQQQHAHKESAPEMSINILSSNDGVESSIAPLSRPPRKRRRKDTEITQVSGATAGNQQSSFVVRIFDRSIDLAHFNADSPLYPICRAWLLNEPSTAGGAGLSDLNISTPPPSSPEGTSPELAEVHSLPKPASWGSNYAGRTNPLIPTPVLPPPALLEPRGCHLLKADMPDIPSPAGLLVPLMVLASQWGVSKGATPLFVARERKPPRFWAVDGDGPLQLRGRTDDVPCFWSGQSEVEGLDEHHSLLGCVVNDVKSLYSAAGCDVRFLFLPLPRVS